MAAASHTTPLPWQLSPQPPKRPRVHSATVSTRTFDNCSKDLKNLGSPHQHVLSPFPAFACPGRAATCRPSSDGVGAGARIRGHCGLNTSGGEFTGDLTAHVLSLSTLVEEDETYVGLRSTGQKAAPLVAVQASLEPVQESVTAQAPEEKLHDAVQTPTPATEPHSSTLPDLYADFKKSMYKGTLETSTAKPVRSTLPYTAHSPHPAASRARSPDTVDIDVLVKKIGDVPAGAQLVETGSEVTEGQKSFGACVSHHEVAYQLVQSQQASCMEDVSKIPTPLQTKRQGPYTSGARMTCPMLSPCLQKESSLQAEHRSAAPDPQSSPPPRKEGLGDAVRLHEVHEPSITASESPSLSRGGQQIHAVPSLEGKRLSTRTSSSGRELDSLLYTSTESALPGSSEFQVVQGDHLQNTAGNPMLWEDFLGHLGGVTFPSLDAQPSEGLTAAEMAPAALQSAAQGCPPAQQACDTLERQRAQLLLQAVEALANLNEHVRRQYIASVSRWNEAPIIAPAAEKLDQILDSPQELEILRIKSKSWQAYCKREAWLQWYSMKYVWLLKDLAVAREANSAVKSELASKGLLSHRQHEISTTAKRIIKHQQARHELQSNADRHHQVAEERMRDVQDDQQLMLRKGQDAREELETEMSNIEDLERRFEEARKLAQQSQLELCQAKHSLLRSKARRVELEQQHYARTCKVTRCSASHLEVSFRGGVTASVAMASDSNLVRISVCPRSKTGNSLVAEFEELEHDLFISAWNATLAGLPKDECKVGQNLGSLMEVTLPSHQVEGAIRHLDCTALRVDEQLSSLRSARSCPELANISANLIMGDSAVLKVFFDLVVPCSHQIVPGPSGLVHVSAMGDSLRVEVTKCIIEISLEPDDSLDSVDWASASVHQACGHCLAAEAVHRTLQELRCASIPEALSGAVQAIRQA